MCRAKHATEEALQRTRGAEPVVKQEEELDRDGLRCHGNSATLRKYHNFRNVSIFNMNNKEKNTVHALPRSEMVTRKTCDVT